VPESIENEFARIRPAHVRKFYIQCRRFFSGDMDRLLVLCVIGDRTLAARNVPKNLRVEDLGYTNVPKEPINLQSIADFSGIPRETVRRKLQDLMVLGWVERDERGNFAEIG